MTARLVPLARVGGGPKAIITLAEKNGWWTVATQADYLFEGKRLIKAQPGEKKGHYEPFTKPARSVLVRGWRGEQRFVLLYGDGKAQFGYWWTRQRSGPDGYDGVHHWVAPTPEPVKVGVEELKTLLTLPQESVRVEA
jgi:hypothetical protein